ncbi:MAG: hypothetical protein ACYTF7_08355, partial [Planctomycetota bacterium]
MRPIFSLSVAAALVCGSLAVLDSQPSLTPNDDTQRKADALRQILENPIGETFLQTVAPDVWSGMALARESDVACAVFAPGTPDWYVDHMMDRLALPREDGSRYQPSSNRWGSGGSVTLYYSFPPDGTNLSGYIGGESNKMFERWSDASAFGSDAAWQDLFAQAFDAWSEVTGNTYIQIADDGAVWPGSEGPFTDAAQNPAVPATLLRGDIRIVSGLVDGSSGTLAFNFF